MAAEKTKTISGVTVAAVIESAKKKYDIRLGPLSEVVEEVATVTTGNLAIDYALGVDGVALGRLYEFAGEPSSGKSTTALQAAAALQKIIKAGGDMARGIGPDDIIVYFDYEQAMDILYAKALGLDVEHNSFLFAQPDSLEQGANIALALLETGKARMLIWDSVAAMNPEAAMNAEVGVSLPAIQARVMSDFLKKLTPSLRNNNCVSLFINHLKEKMVMGGYSRPGMPPPTTTPGGKALKFYASVRVEYTPLSKIKGKIYDSLSNEEIDGIIATNVRVKVVKNKLAPPFRQAVVRVRFGRGFDNFWTALQILVAHKKIPYSTGYWYFDKMPDLIRPEMKLGSTKTKRPYIQGEAAMFEFSDLYPEWRDLVIKAATDLVASGVSSGELGLSLKNPDDDVLPEVMGSAAETEEASSDEDQEPADASDLDEVLGTSGDLFKERESLKSLS